MPIAKRALEIASIGEMMREFGGNLARAHAVCALLSLSDLLMQMGAAGGRQSPIGRFPVQRMLKTKARSNGAIGPFGVAGVLQKRHLSDQRAAALLDMDQIGFACSGERGGG